MKMVQKTTAFERVNHFVLLVSFFVLTFTGFGFMYSALNWMNTAFGGNAWASIFHKWFGIAFAISAAISTMLPEASSNSQSPELLSMLPDEPASNTTSGLLSQSEPNGLSYHRNSTPVNSA